MDELAVPVKVVVTMYGNDAHSSYECARAWVALREVHARINEALSNALAKECALTINDFEVLVHLQAASPERVRLGDLADAVPLSQPALSRLVMRLEQQGLVQRCDAETDRRAVLLELTPNGLATLQRAIPVHVGCIREQLTGRMTDEEQATLVNLLARLQRQDAPV